MQFSATTNDDPELPDARSCFALRWLLHESEAAEELRLRVWAVTTRIGVEGPSEYLDEELQRAEETLVGVHPWLRGWQAAAARAWNSLPEFSRQVLCARHLAHQMGDGERATQWWSQLVIQGHGELVNYLVSATVRFNAAYLEETKRRAA